MDNESIKNLKKELNKRSLTLKRLIKNRPPLKRQNGIPRQIQEFGDGDGVTKALQMEWWEMLFLQKRIVENAEEKNNDLKMQRQFFVEKKKLIREKDSSIKKIYKQKDIDELKKWAINYIKSGKSNSYIKAIGEFNKPDIPKKRMCSLYSPRFCAKTGIQVSGFISSPHIHQRFSDPPPYSESMANEISCRNVSNSF